MLMLIDFLELEMEIKNVYSKEQILTQAMHKKIACLGLDSEKKKTNMSQIFTHITIFVSQAKWSRPQPELAPT